MNNKFNLTEESWIPCLMLETNETKELSLFDTLAQAHEIREIVDNSPLVVVSLHRLLLAILHRNFGPKNFDTWKELWRRGSWDETKLKSYFDEWNERFNLFDDERPFYQYPQVLKAGGKEADIAPLELLMQEKATGNNGTLLDHSFAGKTTFYTAASAIRSLISRQSFSFAGGVSFPFNFGNSTLVSGFSVLANGENLFETLALNLMVYHRDKPVSCQENDEGNSIDLPFWERNNLNQASESDKDGIIPLGYLDYLTWQSRRIRLIKDDSSPAVTSCQVQQNFKLKEGVNLFDPFKVYVKGDTGFYAKNLSEDKSLWRDSHTLLQQAAGINDRSSLFSHLATVESMIASGEIKGVKNYSFSVFGVINDKANVKLWKQEKLPLPLIYLGNGELLKDLETAIQFAEEISGSLRYALKILAENLESNPSSFSAMSIYWSALETEFHRLLSGLPRNNKVSMEEWFQFIYGKPKSDGISLTALRQIENSLNGNANEQRAIVEAKKEFFKARSKILKNTIYQSYLPNYKTKGGSE